MNLSLYKTINMKTEEKIYTKHADHTDWMSKLEFYEDEISIMKNRLSVIASKNSHQDVLAQVEHFQNQLIVQKDNIDEISHTITIDEDAIQKEVEKKSKSGDHIKKGTHAGEKIAVELFEKNFNKLRAEFNEFAVKWM